MNLLTAIEQWVDTRAAKQIEIRMADVARMVRNEVKAQLEDSAATLALETREAVDAHNDLESRVDSLEQTVECNDNGIDDLESRIDDLESTVGDQPSHEEVSDLVRDVINNASISFNL